MLPHWISIIMDSDKPFVLFSYTNFITFPMEKLILIMINSNETLNTLEIYSKRIFKNHLKNPWSTGYITFSIKHLLPCRELKILHILNSG